MYGQVEGIILKLKDEKMTNRARGAGLRALQLQASLGLRCVSLSRL